MIDAARIGTDEVDEAIGGLTPAKRHAAQLAADALHRALAGGCRLRASGSRRPSAVRVLVAMSGGVDSAVAALLERERGAEVVGVTLKLWADPRDRRRQGLLLAGGGARGAGRWPTRSASRTSPSTSRRSSAAASSASSSPATRRAATPNPCIVCNGEVRIAAMVDLAGGSAPTTWSPATTPESSRTATGPLLAAAADANKDQSYMLAALPPAMLERVRFPLTELTKPEVREIAARHEPCRRQEAREPGPLLPRRPG